ncbi:MULTISPECIES: helix-turn-helix domain-containing protein [unclassified Agarivorans]|uniref:helix-turn-helix domain-containing protein n=1 Tax=unclassified Agarivorans TaxID=2636026 RepID=UPI003D7E72AD
MPNNINITNLNNLLPFIDYFERKGIEWKSVAQRYRFPDDMSQSGSWIPSHQAMGFINTMMQNTNQRVGLEVGRLITLEQISPNLHLEISKCQRLEQAVQRLIELMPTLNNHVVIWPEKIDGKWFLCHRGAYHPSALGYDQTEWFRAFALLSLCRIYCGKDWQPASVFMSISSHLASNLPASFRATSFTFSYPFGALEIPLPDNFTPVELQARQSHWLQTLDALIHTYAVLPWFNVEWLALLIGSSPRTLQRHFTELGLTFRRLRDEARCTRAKTLLREGVSPFETAWLCGYNDLSNFNRAFKGWLKQTPSQYQRLCAK